MNKPHDYDSVNINYVPLSAGGHKCVIKQVEEMKSSTGKDMLKVSFDMANDDSQPLYYMNQYIADKKTKKPDELKWRGVQYVLVEGDFGTANLKRFVTSVEDSNAGFAPQWGPNFAAGFKNTKVGVIFREEEYEKQDGSIGKTSKPFRFCNYAEAFEQPVPEPRKLDKPVSATAPSFVAPSDPALANEGFMHIPDELADEGLPFN